MILAEKIIKLRKQMGWSQEDLAMRMDVSRQSVSKWESCASIPDINKILQLGELFGVSTDYLLKDDYEEPIGAYSLNDTNDDRYNYDRYNDDRYNINDTDPVRKVSMEEAVEYVAVIKKYALRFAIAVMLCILSPVPMFIMAGKSEVKGATISEDMAGGFGVCILLVMVAIAVGIFISGGMKMKKFEFLETENIETEYGIAGMAEKSRDDFEPIFRKNIMIGVAMCIVAVIPLLIAGALSAAEMTLIYTLCLMFIVISIAVFIFVWSSMIWACYHKLLEEGDYSRDKKKESKRHETYGGIYWCLIVAVYLAVSFLTRRWDMTWIIWPCAGVLYAALCGIIKAKGNLK